MTPPATRRRFGVDLPRATAVAGQDAGRAGAASARNVERAGEYSTSAPLLSYTASTHVCAASSVTKAPVQ